MGRYTRKSKISDNVGLMEVSQPTIGVRTRAKTLALQRLQSSDASCYLQLRSRRLEKPSALKPQENSEIRGPLPRSASSRLRAGCNSVNPDSFKTKGRFESRVAVETGYEHDLDAEASFGENNNLEFEPRERTPCSFLREVDATTPGSSTKQPTVNAANQNNRSSAVIKNVVTTIEIEGFFASVEQQQQQQFIEKSTRESTPCSLIREVDAAAPGSSTRQKDVSAVNRRNRSAILENIPSGTEIEEFFARANQQQQRQFIEKYNYDVVNDVPLPGRYGWVRVNP